MQYSITPGSTTLVVKISGTFRFDDHDGFKGVIKAIDAHEGNQVEISLAGTSAIDSAGVGMLLLAHERTKKQNKHLFVTGAGGTVAKVLELTRMSSLIDIR